MSHIEVDLSVVDQYLNAEFTGAWHDREHQALMAAESRAPVYAIAAPLVMDREPLEDVFLPRYMHLGMQTLYGKGYVYLPQYQARGTCVGQSHASGVTMVAAINALLAGAKFPGRAAVAPIYGGSRVDIGRQPGRWDGSTGSWAAQWLTRFGYVTMLELGINDNPGTEKGWLASLKQDEQLAVQWAASRSGAPANVEELAKQKPIKETPLVTTVEEVRAALSNLTPVNLCGSVHPSQDLDEKGVSRSIKRGGGHSTIIVGMQKVNGKWWYDHMQSWWFYYRGGYCRPGNRIDAQFKGCVTRIPESWLVSWLRERDSYALVGVQGLTPIDLGFL